MTIHILNKNETQEIEKSLKDQFGIKEIPGILLKIGQERIFLFQGSFNEEEIINLEKTVPIERVGVYFAKMQNGKIRLSIEGTHLLKNQITKNIFDLNEEQVQKWMSGSEILFDEENKSKFDNNKSSDKGMVNEKDLIINNDDVINKKFSIHDIKNKISERSKPNLGWASDFAKCGTKLVERGRELGRDKSVKQKLHGFLIMKYKDDLLGTGKASENKITNFIPKSRRLKERS